MQLETPNKISVLIGHPETLKQQQAWAPFDDRVLKYLAEVSRGILALSDVRDFPDLVSLAYWCRPAAISRLAKRHESNEVLIGRGMVFHIPPANVPLNFAYSLLCGLLAGNTNIVRLSSTESSEVNALIDVFRTLHQSPSVSEVADRICLVRYEHDDAITREFSRASAARLIWGGNKTVRKIREIESAPRSVDVSFADRVSVAIMHSETVQGLHEESLSKLAENFIADGYTFDQNACSSPRLVIWNGNEESMRMASQRFWPAVEQKLASREVLSPAHHMLRFVELCEFLSNNETDNYLLSFAGGTTRLGLKNAENWRNFTHLRFGTFTEVCVSDLATLGQHFSSDVQTLGYFGFTPDAMLKIFKSMNTDGIDRIVPIGQALNFDTFWDGYDLVRTLTRTVVII